MLDTPSLRLQTGNRLLDKLPAEEYRRLQPRLTPVRLAFKKVLYKARKPIDYVYFLTGGVASAVAVMDGGSAIEVGNIGSEGVTGSNAALGAFDSPNEVFMQ